MPNSPPRTPAQAQPAIAVVVPATDRPATLPRCLAAIESARSPGDGLVVVESPEGLGPAAARNRGARSASADGAEIVLFVDSDVEVHPDALDRVRAAFASDPGLAAVFGSYDESPAEPGVVSRFRNLLHASVHESGAGEASTFWAGLGAVRADVLAESGGFDEKLFARPAVEDVELGARIDRAGHRIVNEPAIRGKHLKRWTAASMARTDALSRAEPWTRLALAGRAPADTLNLARRRRIGAALALLVAGLAAARRPRATALAALALIVAEAPLFSLLHRSGGLRLAGAGLPLLVLHHLSAAVGALVGLFRHLRDPIDPVGPAPSERG